MHKCELKMERIVQTRVVHITMAKNQVQSTDWGTLHFRSTGQLYYPDKLSASCFTWKAVLSDHTL